LIISGAGEHYHDGITPKVWSTFALIAVKYTKNQIGSIYSNCLNKNLSDYPATLPVASESNHKPFGWLLTNRLLNFRWFQRKSCSMAIAIEKFER
jgi:hypothetical protein